MILQLPFPDPKLNPNVTHGRRFSTNTQARQVARDTGFLLAKEAMQDQTFQIADSYSLLITFYSPDNRHRDADNLLSSLKRYIDGICLALEIDDKLFRHVSISFGEIRKKGATQVEIVPLEEA